MRSTLPQSDVPISCIICAFNEAPRIAAVLGVVSGHPLREEVIVVDDGSSTWESLQAAQRGLKAKNLNTVLLVSDPYHSLRLLGIGNEVGIEGYVSPTAGRSSFKTLVRETVLVSVGRIIGYRRMVALFE